MPRALCIFVLGSLSVHIFIMGTIIKEMMQIQFLALNLWVCIMLDLNGFSSASYQGILVKYIFFFQRKKKNPWERKMNTSPPFHSWKRCCEVRINTRAGLGVEMSVRAWARHCFWARQQGPVNGSDRTPDQKGDSARQSVNVSAGDNGALPGEARPWEQQLLLQGSSVYSNQKAERNADCQGETFLGWTQTTFLSRLTGHFCPSLV